MALKTERSTGWRETQPVSGLKTPRVKPTEELESPRRTQDSGDNTPSVWGKAAFQVKSGKSDSKSLSHPHSVDLKSGQHSQHQD